MKRLCAILLFLVLPGLAPAQGNYAAEYEALLSALAVAETPAEADGLVPQIWNHWLTAPDPVAQEALDTALEHRRAYDFLGALSHLDRLVETYPDYAEGWNQRATIYFLTGNFEKSLADVDEVLKREPRHFGALAGRAMIYYQQGRVPLAQIAVREALKFHPFLAERAILDVPAGEDL
ncbi:tetratricopeptide repeat protein [Pseudoruegeria sp. HB172150]|uniref:tetratricopeptide repeat protein n=1 Tax=Pseudoruegeria sp. HB172150 TaxID=2721164 RepID=UPI0015551588|nr:tetratricopeptide repeat protein [Pseudoruegeria sp. HB172150]